jgi:hypothetical protein
MSDGVSPAIRITKYPQFIELGMGFVDTPFNVLIDYSAKPFRGGSTLRLRLHSHGEVVSG